VSGQEEVSPLHDQAEALVSEVRELREGYEQLVARIDEALAVGQTDDAASSPVPHPQGGASGRELYLLTVAMSGSTREDAAALFTEQFGEEVDEELLESVFGSVPPSPAEPRRGFLRRRQ